MKDKIHPKYENAKVSCACGNEFETKSTIGTKDFKVEICSSCHPFFTGKQKLLDSAGRVEKFNRKFGRTTTTPTATTTSKETDNKKK